MGIQTLARRPFLRLVRDGQQEGVVPARVLYPYALHSSQEERVERAALVVAAAVRQAHEMYTAAKAGGVADLARPILYFYGAMGLAKAATVALFGADGLEERHGLSRSPGPTAASDHAPWPTLIQWEAEGQFPTLYRASRWDRLYACCSGDAGFRNTFNQKSPLQFHVLECIRAVQYDWGTLPPTGLAQAGSALFPAQAHQALLLPFRGPDDLYMTSRTELTTPLVEAPRVLVLYMLLYYFSILARYYPAEWQRLLAADEGPEGYVFRVAMERAAHDYPHEVAKMLQYTAPPWTFGREAITGARPVIEDWRQPLQVGINPPQGIRVSMYALEEWDGTPPDTCAKAMRILAPLAQ
jgi:hypothetical protein